MTQRNLAAVLAAPLLIGLWVVVLTQPLPYVTYKPGVTVDVLGDRAARRSSRSAGTRPSATTASCG